MMIDMHTHVFPPKIAAAALNKLSLLSHTVPQLDGTAEGLAASMEKAGVDWSIVLPVATSARQVPHINDSSARLNEAMGGRGIFSFGCIHPDCDNYRQELANVAALGLKGVKIHPVYQEVDLDDVRYLRILERAGELGLLVVTHAGEDIGYPGVVRCSPEMVQQAVTQVGPVKLILAHMGGWREWRRVCELLAGTQVFLDTSYSHGSIIPLEDGYYKPEDLPLMSEREFLEMVHIFGPERILFGTDSPWRSQKEDIAWLSALPLSQPDKDAILGGNARRLLGFS
jgi:predicted TIM-barrel fold metal-dependent hydrolase